jgi:hypothetical protein
MIKSEIFINIVFDIEKIPKFKGGIIDVKSCLEVEMRTYESMDWGGGGEKMEKTCQNVSILSELIEKPSNLERWHLLPGRDNTTNELTRKALAIEEFLSTKEDQAYEKDIILEEVYFSKLFFTNLMPYILTKSWK